MALFGQPKCKCDKINRFPSSRSGIFAQISPMRTLQASALGHSTIQSAPVNMPRVRLLSSCC